MSDQVTSICEREIRIAASPETIFRFLVEPLSMTRWMGLVAQLDARPGGAFRVEVGKGREAVGEFVDIDKPRRVVFTWGWTGADAVVGPGASTVEITLEPDGDQTLLRLIHTLPSPQAADAHGIGWDNYLPRLATAAEGDDPGPDLGPANVQIDHEE